MCVCLLIGRGPVKTITVWRRQSEVFEKNFVSQPAWEIYRVLVADGWIDIWLWPSSPVVEGSSFRAGIRCWSSFVSLLLAASSPVSPLIPPPFLLFFYRRAPWGVARSAVSRSWCSAQSDRDIFSWQLVGEGECSVRILNKHRVPLIAWPTQFFFLYQRLFVCPHRARQWKPWTVFGLLASRRVTIVGCWGVFFR